MRTLVELLEEQEALAGKSEREWRAAFPGCKQATYRNGMWYAFHEAVRMAREADGRREREDRP